eukprot:3873236-Rhodomonas_salina.2
MPGTELAGATGQWSASPSSYRPTTQLPSPTRHTPRLPRLLLPPPLSPRGRTAYLSTLLLGDVRYCPSARYAMSGTDVAHAILA